MQILWDDGAGTELLPGAEADLVREDDCVWVFGYFAAYGYGGGDCRESFFGGASGHGIFAGALCVFKCATAFCLYAAARSEE